MLVFLAVLIAAISNLDNLIVGAGLGLAGRRIGWPANLIVASVTMLATASGMTSGRVLSRFIPPAAGATLGASTIIGLGLGAGFASFQTRDSDDRQFHQQ